MGKDLEIKARVTQEMRDQIAEIADQRGEATSVIVREAIKEYLERSARESEASKAPVNPPSGKGTQPADQLSSAAEKLLKKKAAAKGATPTRHRAA